MPRSNRNGTNGSAPNDRDRFIAQFTQKNREQLVILAAVLCGKEDAEAVAVEALRKFSSGLSDPIEMQDVYRILFDLPERTVGVECTLRRALYLIMKEISDRRKYVRSDHQSQASEPPPGALTWP